MSKNQKEDEGRLEAEHGKLDNRDSSDDVKLLSHRKGADEPDPLGADIRDVPEASDTQWDEWLLKTEPLQGARPKWNKGRGATSSGTRPDGGLEHRSSWGCSWPERGTSWIGRSCKRRKW